VSSSIAIADVLRKAGLRAEPDLQPKSLRMWFATTTLTRTGSIVEVARLLGVRSLDTAARWASWDWPAEGDDER
jgi:integrase/recombinase XerC